MKVRVTSKVAKEYFYASKANVCKAIDEKTIAGVKVGDMYLLDLGENGDVKKEIKGEGSMTGEEKKLLEEIKAAVLEDARKLNLIKAEVLSELYAVRADIKNISSPETTQKPVVAGVSVPETQKESVDPLKAIKEAVLANTKGK